MPEVKIWKLQSHSGLFWQTQQPVILSPFAVILSVAKNLALLAQGKLREGSRSECFQGRARFFIADAPQNDSRAWSFSATCEAFFQSGEKDD